MMDLGKVIKGKLDLVGTDGNAVAIMANVRRALLRAGNPRDTVDAVIAEMRSGNYDHVLYVAGVVVESDDASDDEE